MADVSVADDSSVESSDELINSKAKVVAPAPSVAKKSKARGKTVAAASVSSAVVPKKRKTTDSADAAEAPAAPAPAPAAAAVDVSVQDDDAAADDEPKPKRKGLSAASLEKRKETIRKKKEAALALVKDGDKASLAEGKKKRKKLTPAEREKARVRHAKLVARSTHKAWKRPLSSDGTAMAIPAKAARTLIDEVCLDQCCKRRMSKGAKLMFANHVGLVIDRLVHRSARALKASKLKQLTTAHVLDAASALNMMGDSERYSYAGNSYCQPVPLDRDNLGQDSRFKRVEYKPQAASKVAAK